MSQTSGATVTMRYQRLSPISRLACVLGAIVGLAAAAITIITPLDLQSQAFFGLFTAVVFLVINRFRGRAATLCLMALSAVVSTRYLWWRSTETLGFSDPFGMVFGYGLYAAELYAWVVLIIGYLTGPAIAGNEPPPAAVMTALVSNTCPESVVTRNSGSPIFSTLETISLRWKVGLNGLICSISPSVRPWPVTIGMPGMS